MYNDLRGRLCMFGPNKKANQTSMQLIFVNSTLIHPCRSNGGIRSPAAQEDIGGTAEWYTFARCRHGNPITPNRRLFARQ
jgi:hypothetical protein